MDEFVLKIKLINKDAVMPKYDHDDDAGFGIFTVEEKTLKPGEIYAFSTGLSSEIPKGFFVSFRDRSSMGLKGIHVLGGVIDAGYRGEWKIILINLSAADYKVEKGNKIIQGILHKVEKGKIISGEELTQSSRGGSGFGSTGK